MIGFLKGTLASKKGSGVLIDVQGVGYEVFMPVSAIASMPAQGNPVFVHIHTHVREDGIKLFGFASEQEKQVFVTLLGVNGVGPKMALNILSGLSWEAFAAAVEKEDVTALSKIPGVGKKTAGRIILELRQKLPSMAGEGAQAPAYDDALSALLNLGYRKPEAQDALDKAVKKGAEGLEMLLRDALKELTKS
ncbi:MAG: Holliday junction branch migration protein RuvA [Nitrospiraceae bacterium]|nr:Holliday junction branch migration protein RuvA [Nitrospiraceae bacterium]